MIPYISTKKAVLPVVLIEIRNSNSVFLIKRNNYRFIKIYWGKEIQSYRASELKSDWGLEIKKL